jgi:hypothetical protein
MMIIQTTIYIADAERLVTHEVKNGKLVPVRKRRAHKAKPKKGARK